MSKTRVIVISIVSFIIAAAGLYIAQPRYAVVVTGPEVEKIDYPAPDLSNLHLSLPQTVPGHVETQEMRSSRYFDYMAMNTLMNLHSALQGREHPVVLEIKEGVYKLSDLESRGQVERGEEGWIVRIPLIVHPSATLIIEEKDPVYLSAQTGAFISSFGKLFIVKSTIDTLPAESGSERYNRKVFRPYIVIWSGGKGYFSESSFYNLGYDYPKSYGITFSSSAIMEREEGEKPAPEGILTGNHFENLYYGFYSYEARNITIAHNSYEENIVYGIDPHDYSENLLIAFNDVSKTKEKHGIILSRNILNSIVYGNRSHRNKGSGIMIERNSTKNIVARNVVEGNEGDGLVFLESPDNVSHDNIIRDNHKSGVRIRNSWNLSFNGDDIVGNADFGLMAYTRSLRDQKDRDLTLDPYQKRLDFSMQDCDFIGNEKAYMTVKNASRVTFSNLMLLKSPKAILGDFQSYNTDIQTHGVEGGSAISLVQKPFYADFLSSL